MFRRWPPVRPPGSRPSDAVDSLAAEAYVQTFLRDVRTRRLCIPAFALVPVVRRLYRGRPQRAANHSHLRWCHILAAWRAEAATRQRVGSDHHVRHVHLRRLRRPRCPRGDSSGHRHRDREKSHGGRPSSAQSTRSTATARPIVCGSRDESSGSRSGFPLKKRCCAFGETPHWLWIFALTSSIASPGRTPTNTLPWPCTCSLVSTKGGI